MQPSNEKINVIGQSKAIYVFYKSFYETTLYTSTYEGSNLLSHIFNAWTSSNYELPFSCYTVGTGTSLPSWNSYCNCRIDDFGNVCPLKVCKSPCMRLMTMVSTTILTSH